MLYSRFPRSVTVSGLPNIRRSTIVTIAAGRAMRKLTLNLSFISQPWDLVAAMVVSEIMERLSPNIAPPTQAPRKRGMLKPPLSATPTAIGTIAEMVPIDVPVAVPMNAEMMNTPAARKCTGIIESPRFMVASRPPISPATVENAPASRNIISMVRTSTFAAPFENRAKRSSMDPLVIRNAISTAMNIAATEGNW